MLCPFKVISGVNDKPMITVKYKGQEKNLCAEEISSITHKYEEDCRDLFEISC